LLLSCAWQGKRWEDGNDRGDDVVSLEKLSTRPSLIINQPFFLRSSFCSGGGGGGGRGGGGGGGGVY